MRRIYTVFFSTVVIFLCCCFSAQNNSCMDLFHKAFGKMKDMSPKPSKGLSVEYVVTVQTVDGNTYTDNIHLNIYNNRASIISSDVTIYQDEKAMVAIRPEANTIFMTRPADEMF